MLHPSNGQLDSYFREIPWISGTVPLCRWHLSFSWLSEHVQKTLLFGKQEWPDIGTQWIFGYSRMSLNKKQVKMDILIWPSQVSLQVSSISICLTLSFKESIKTTRYYEASPWCCYFCPYVKKIILLVVYSKVVT